jgi:hypothetical protein
MPDDLLRRLPSPPARTLTDIPIPLADAYDLLYTPTVNRHQRRIDYFWKQRPSHDYNAPASQRSSCTEHNTDSDMPMMRFTRPLIKAGLKVASLGKK